jgi:thioredoxin reductase (NADPH)
MGCKAAIDADGYLEDLERERAAAETEEPAAAEGDD